MVPQWPWCPSYLTRLTKNISSTPMVHRSVPRSVKNRDKILISLIVTIIIIKRIFTHICHMHQVTNHQNFCRECTLTTVLFMNLMIHLAEKSNIHTVPVFIVPPTDIISGVTNSAVDRMLCSVSPTWIHSAQTVTESRSFIYKQLFILTPQEYPVILANSSSGMIYNVKLKTFVFIGSCVTKIGNL